ncbi:MAG TPA: hypothetical protein VFR92_10185 [Sphingomicrobium sp.]|jgi:hypothetical protein|nr:hypothetical protein [Sphingomicrobium sp.]
MDGYREHPADFDLSGSNETAASHDVAAAIGTDERRMHVRAYNYWVSLLDGRDFPSIEDLEPGEVQDFAGHSVLLDFTCGRDNPAIPYIGAAIRDECGLSDDTRNIADVPSRSLLSRLTDHYMQIIANRAPIGFEAEFLNQREENICYRGILMPFSSDGEQIDFIYGVINWKTVSASAVPQIDVPCAEPEDDVLLLDEEAVAEPFEPAPAPEAALPEEHLMWEDGPSAEVEAETAEAPEPAETENEALPRVPFAWEEGVIAEAEPEEVAELVLDENAGLADRLWAARETAETVKAGEGRTRSALYRALSLAYDVALVAQHNPEEYAELLEESGVKAQARAPMTPIVKLVFGVDYDKARLTEFAAALSYAQRQDIALGRFKEFIEKQPGGLKALVAAERQARRPDNKPDTRGDAARARLRSAPAMSLSDLPAEEEFAVVITRRSPDGAHEAVAVVHDESLVERAIRKAG